MIALRKFEEFILLKIVTKQSPDNERAKNLILESEDKLKFFEKVKRKIGREELNSNYIIETCYDILIELLRAKILTLGYKTDSHEAEISYMRNLNFSEREVAFMNQLRYVRNGIKYYGRILEQDYADEVFIFMERIYLKLKRILK
jgi:hypothetical protein